MGGEWTEGGVGGEGGGGGGVGGEGERGDHRGRVAGGTNTQGSAVLKTKMVSRKISSVKGQTLDFTLVH